MKSGLVELERTTDPVRLSFLRAVLDGAGVPSAVFEENVRALWPGAFAARLMVAAEDEAAARTALVEADPREAWR